MTNYGAGYIMRAKPPQRGERQLRYLLAVETVTADKDGWRTAGLDLLADRAGLPRWTLSRGRDEAIEAKRAEYIPGRGRGIQSRHRLLIPPLDKGTPTVPFSEGAKRGQSSRQKGTVEPVKGDTQESGEFVIPAVQGPYFDWFAKPAALSAEAEALLKLSASAAGSAAAAPNGAAAPPAADPIDLAVVLAETKAELERIRQDKRP